MQVHKAIATFLSLVTSVLLTIGLFDKTNIILSLAILTFSASTSSAYVFNARQGDISSIIPGALWAFTSGIVFSGILSSGILFLMR